MYIEPNTNIRLLKDTPLDNTYRNTIYFASASAQSSYFSGLTKYSLTDYSYQRQQKTLRVGILADNLYDCNYLMFQNTSFGSKWFYAFITSVQYVNNECSEITFEMDVMQTWFFNYEVNQSFIEREHPETDAIGSNLIPENLELGEYIGHDFIGTGILPPQKIVMACTFNKEMQNVAGGTYAGIYSGLIFNVFDSYTDANTFIEEATTENKSDGIIACFMIPQEMIVEPGGSARFHELSFEKWFDDIDGYTPKNNKLFTHPYNFLYCTNLDGNYAEFKYEYFDASSCTFGLTGDMACNPQTILFPQNYKGLVANYNEKMVLDGFPQCPFTTDTFKAWLAQNASSMGVSMLGSAMTAVAGGAMMYATGGVLGGGQVASGLTQIAGTLAQVHDRSSLPRQAHGSSGSSASSAIGIKDFAFIHMTIRAEFAKIVDDFFSMYGYATHRVKVPNRSSRPHWNYVKTQNVSVTGSVPADDLKKIRSVYDTGVTFWKNGANVGNYSLNNKP